MQMPPQYCYGFCNTWQFRAVSGIKHPSHFFFIYPKPVRKL